MDDDFTQEDEFENESRLWRYLLPLGLLVVCVAVVCALVLTGIVKGEAERAGGGRAPTTAPTIQIVP